MQKRIHTKNHSSKTNRHDLKVVFSKLASSPKRLDMKKNKFAKWREKYINSIASEFKEKFKAKFGKDASEVKDVQTA